METIYQVQKLVFDSV